MPALLEALEVQAARLALKAPPIRLAVTGDGLVYRIVDGRTLDIDLDLPDTRQSLGAVFGGAASHLIALANPLGRRLRAASRCREWPHPKLCLALRQPTPLIWLRSRRALRQLTRVRSTPTFSR
jgi:phytoene dehydrogenase-like protein